MAAKFAVAHGSFAAQGLQKVSWNYNMASQVLPIWKTTGGAHPPVTQVGNNSLSPVRFQLSSISCLRVVIESGSL